MLPWAASVDHPGVNPDNSTSLNGNNANAHRSFCRRVVRCGGFQAGCGNVASVWLRTLVMDAAYQLK